MGDRERHRQVGQRQSRFIGELDELFDGVEAHPPGLALQKWLLRSTAFLATKDGLASALAWGSTSFDTLRNHILDTLEPTLRALLDAATADSQTRPDVTARQLMYAVRQAVLACRGRACRGPPAMVAILLDGLRYGA